jgi:NTE family protein
MPEINPPPNEPSPVNSTGAGVTSNQPLKGMGLCLSGGGYRAMIFHVGSLIRLNEAGLLKKMDRISSVSGGSIVAAMLGLRWKQLTFQNDVATNFTEMVVAPVRAMAEVTIDVKAVIKGLLLPGTVNDRIIAAYKKHLYGEATLKDLPDDTEGPRFVINATNVQSGVLWRFSRPYMADYLVGMVKKRTVPLAVAVAASSAFPPFLSPARLNLEHADFEPDPKCPLQKEPYTTDVFLSDGGVYDNLGLETVWKQFKTVLVSDGGGQMKPAPKPKSDWAQHGIRVAGIVDNQVRSLRRRIIVSAFMNPADPHEGTFWGIRSHVKDYPNPNPALPCPEARTLELAETPTRLKRLEPAYQDRLINWGYAMCDTALRSHYTPMPAQAKGFPYPGGV